MRSLEEAEKYVLMGLELCEKIGLHLWNAGAQLHLGAIYFEKGDFLRSSSSFEKGYRVFEENQLCPSWVILGKAGVARAKVMNKEKNVDLESLFTSSRCIKTRVAEGWIAHYIGDILLNMEYPEAAKAEHWIQKAIEADQRNGMMFHLGLDHALCAECFKRKGSRTEAIEHLGKSIEILRERGAKGWVEKYEMEMAKLI